MLHHKPHRALTTRELRAALAMSATFEDYEDYEAMVAAMTAKSRQGHDARREYVSRLERARTTIFVRRGACV
jgi:hypothetical protein